MTTELPRDFKGIWIPREIWLDNRLSLLEKCIAVEIDSLDCGEEHCYAKPEHFEKLFNASTSTVAKAFAHLKKLGYWELVSFDGRPRVIKSNLKYSHGEFDRAGVSNLLGRGCKIYQGGSPRDSIEREIPLELPVKKEEEEKKKKQEASPPAPPSPVPSNKIPQRKKCPEEKSEMADRVFVTPSQHASLLKDAKGNLELVNAWYDRLSKWKISKEETGGRNDYRALIGWVRDAVKEDVAKKSHSPENRIQSSREFCEKIKKACPGIENRSGITFGNLYVEYAPSPYCVTEIKFTDHGFEEQVKGLARKLGYVLKDL